jgi:hypothetical protein
MRLLALLSIGVATTAAADPLELRTLEGPFTSIRAYCATQPDTRCETQVMFTGKRRAAGAPFDEVRLFAIEDLDPHCQLGIRIGKQWFVLPEAVRCLGERAKSTLVAKVTKLAVEDWQPGGSRELVLRATYDQSLEDYSPQDFDRTHFETLVVCGLGASGVPACTRELPFKGKRTQIVRRKKPVVTTFAIAIRPTADGVELAGDMSTIEQYLFKPLVPGTYALPFP